MSFLALCSISSRLTKPVASSTLRSSSLARARAAARERPAAGWSLTSAWSTTKMSESSGVSDSSASTIRPRQRVPGAVEKQRSYVSAATLPSP